MLVCIMNNLLLLLELKYKLLVLLSPLTSSAAEDCDMSLKADVRPNILLSVVQILRFYLDIY